jgi:hypothetical protein
VISNQEIHHGIEPKAESYEKCRRQVDFGTKRIQSDQGGHEVNLILLERSIGKHKVVYVL